VNPQAVSVRPAAVAGAFYPASPQRLSGDIAEMLDGVDLLEPRLGVPKALIVPHAGYMYSGPIAARAYDALAAARGMVKRVVLLGPAHFVAGRGMALPGVQAFDTPLGRTQVDADAVAALEGLKQVVQSAPAHAQEHSLEVQLPFLQHVLGNEFSLLPIALGAATNEEVAEVLERLWGGPETLIVISTDMSHYMDYESARRVDGATLQKIAGFATDIDHVEACGATPLNGFLGLAKEKGLSIRLLAAGNSGDTAGGKDRVVGYSAFALYEGGEVSLDKAGATLLAIARVSIAHALGLGPKPRKSKTAWLTQRGASFVTLTLDGKLRGCIGSLSPTRALADDVAANALAAAFEDPRFTKLTRDEWKRCALEVSLLSTPRALAFADEADLLSQLAPGEDGVILENEGRRATFLPQVWEGLPDPRAFLGELLKKAGLPPETRLARCRVWRYRVSKFHGRALVA
jgi:AmmeMemoRadiSam system protein B/AmmeMemoRadiSam system protein A